MMSDRVYSVLQLKSDRVHCVLQLTSDRVHCYFFNPLDD